MDKTDKIGVAGCGRMGMPMLASLLHAGFNAHGFDIRDVGVETDVDTFCKGLTTLITVVRDADDTDAVLFDVQAILSCAPQLRTLIISSTLSPRYVMALRDRVPSHIRMVDAPMSGAQVRAEAGTLAFMLGGDDPVIAECLPLFNAMGQDLHRMGAFGAGMTAKVLNNLLAAGSTAMTRLVLDWADSAGVDERKLLDLIHTASGQNWFASGFDTIEFARDGYATDNTIGILVKDVAAALDIAPDGADTALPKTVQRVIAGLPPRAKNPDAP
ncbi:3-hydroxyisobutyrate dehydrogenase [Cognatiyoonia koreensis]|uniref:3-hydroxyisobutyrate dehydrogenase n=1 Tax=Cognatiyoonia koreensis TaxID=364200 RepID=A0A1I0MNR8_9RHOB|nr:NAD(P)-dependent oxidoreductase [Cognatiyoonia koreensis]SEV89502.1 3-hydroxyisobutyrate dehydrogenase [Cognatiyoonia koreensis]